MSTSSTVIDSSSNLMFTLSHCPIVNSNESLSFAPIVIEVLILCFLLGGIFFTIYSLTTDLIKLLKHAYMLPMVHDDWYEIQMASIDKVDKILEKLSSEPCQQVSLAEPQTTSNSSSSSRRSSLKNRRCKGPDHPNYLNLKFDFAGPDNSLIVLPDHPRISLFTDEPVSAEDLGMEETLNQAEAAEGVAIQAQLPNDTIKVSDNDKKPFEWYLRWDLPHGELEKLTYSEKARRFYHLSNFGEVFIEVEPPEAIELTEDHQDPDTEILKQPELLKQPIVPVNQLSDLVKQANQVNVPQTQMHLLKLNSLLNCSFLNRLKSSWLSNQLANAFKQGIEVRDALIARKYYLKPQIPYKMPLLQNAIKHAYSDISAIHHRRAFKLEFRRIEHNNETLNQFNPKLPQSPCRRYQHHTIQ